MGQLIDLVSNYEISVVIVIVLLFVLALKGILETVDWYKNRMNGWRHEINKKEDQITELNERMTSVENRVTKLEENDEVQHKQLEDIIDKLTEMYEDNKKETVASFRNALYRIWRDIKSRNPIYVTDIEYETFSEMADIYLSRNGNHIMANVIIPEVKELYEKQNSVPKE